MQESRATVQSAAEAEVFNNQELLTEILSVLDAKTVAVNCTSVNRSWKQASQNPVLWQKLSANQTTLFGKHLADDQKFDLHKNKFQAYCRVLVQMEKMTELDLAAEIKKFREEALNKFLSRGSHLSFHKDEFIKLPDNFFIAIGKKILPHDILTHPYFPSNLVAAKGMFAGCVFELLNDETTNKAIVKNLMLNLLRSNYLSFENYAPLFKNFELGRLVFQSQYNFEIYKLIPRNQDVLDNLTAENFLRIVKKFRQLQLEKSPVTRADARPLVEEVVYGVMPQCIPFFRGLRMIFGP